MEVDVWIQYHEALRLDQSEMFAPPDKESRESEFESQVQH